MKITGLMLAGACLGMASSAFADSTLALACLGCHQASVNSSEMPALNRLSAAAIANALRRARDQPSPGSIMARFVGKMSDADIEAVANALSRTGTP